MGSSLMKSMESRPFQYIRKSKFEVFSKLRTLKNHRTIAYLKQVEPGTSDSSLNPLLVVKPVDNNPGQYPKETERNIKTSVIQTGGSRDQKTSIEEEALNSE